MRFVVHRPLDGRWKIHDALSSFYFSVEKFYIPPSYLDGLKAFAVLLYSKETEGEDFFTLDSPTINHRFSSVLRIRLECDDINQQGPNGESILGLLCLLGEPNQVERAIQLGADVNRHYFVFPMWTLLHLACSRGNVELARVLLACGADINAQSRDGVTPLMTACTWERGSQEIAIALVEGGADLNLLDRFGRSALALCCISGYTQLGSLLIDNGADHTTNYLGVDSVVGLCGSIRDERIIQTAIDRNAGNYLLK